jgi:hypothetical protein
METKVIFSKEFLGNLFVDTHYSYVIFYNFDGEIITIQSIDKEGVTEQIV